MTRSVDRPLDRTQLASVPEARRPARPPASAPRVVFVSAVYPLPTDGGNKVVLAGLLRYFTERLGAENVHWVHVGDLPADSVPLDVPLHPVPGPGTLDRLQAVASRTLRARASLQESVLWSRATRTAILWTLATLDPDLVVVDTVRMSQYVDVLPVASARVCYLDDLFSERYRSMIDLMAERPDVRVRPLATFSRFVPERMRWLADWRPTQRALLALEAALVARSEERTAAEFDTCLLVNENETRRLRARSTDDADVRTIVPLARTTADRGGAPRDRGTHSATYVVMGILSGPHNDIGVRWLVSEVLPLLWERTPDARVEVIGRDPSPELQQMTEAAGDRVQLLGWVDDVQAHLDDACALVNPPQYPSGIKLKVLDALAAGTPVVSTPSGVHGVVTGPGQGVLIAASAPDFADAMVRLRDPALNRETSAHGAEHHDRHFSLEAVFAHYDRLFDPHLPGTRPLVPTPRAAADGPP